MAREHFFYAALRKSIISFLDVFDNINIAKYDSSGDVDKYVKCNIKYMPKEKWWSWANDRKHENRLPTIGVEMSSMSYDETRASGTQENITISIGDTGRTFTANVTPFNLTFNLHIMTKYQHEMDQINEILLTWFNPLIYTKVSIGDLGLTWDMPIVLDSASIDTETDIDKSGYRNIKWTHTYTCKTNLVKPVHSVKPIHKVVNKIYLSEELLSNRDTTTDAPSGVGSFNEELLIIGTKIEDEISTRMRLYGQNISGTLIPVNATLPQIGGVLSINKVLISTTGMWENSPTSFLYQWNRNTTPIENATNSTYTVTSSDLNQDITCTVTASNSKGGTSATSEILVSGLYNLILGSFDLTLEGDNLIIGVTE